MEDVLILKWSLINAIQHKGKADTQAVIGKIISERPELKERLKEIMPEVKKTVEKINSLSLEKQKKKLDGLGFSLEEKEVEKKKELPDLPGVEIGKVVMRLAPFPSGPLHIGNARMAILNDEYVKRYKGKLLLIIDDTIGSEEKFVLSEAYDLIVDGLKWLDVKWDGIFYKSDRMQLFYDIADNLIKKGFAYVCECDIETLRKNRSEGIVCVHRKQNIEENLKKWKDMLDGKYKEGEAVLRLKTDMKHANPAFRDRVLLRIVKREHPKVGKKYRVWPLLEFSWAVDDHFLGITHILRGKDLVMEDMMEEFIWNKLGWKKSEFVHYGLFSIKGKKMSTTASRKAIKKGVYAGWDDPRTWSLQSLRKRGIQPEAIRNFIIGLGLSLSDITIPAEILYAKNRKIIDPLANRYFCVLDPVEISIVGYPIINEVEAKLHPDFPERGKRKIPVDMKKIYIEKSDFDRFKNREIRLMDLVNVRLKKISEFTSRKMKPEMPKIQWVSEPNVRIKIVTEDGSIKEAIAEKGIKDIKVNQLIQLVRTGFCRCDKVDKEIVLYLSHK